MKSRKAGKKKVVYEENPWGDDEPIIGKPVKNFFSPEQLEQLLTTPPDVIKGKRNGDIPLPMTEEDMKLLRRQAKKAGLGPKSLLAGIAHDYLHGNLVRP